METWKRTLYVLWAAELVAIAGFAVVFPFLPYYVQELGITELHQVELWSGALIAVQAVTMTLFAPLWGALADRYGRKLMVERAMFAGAVTLSLMGLVQNVWQLALLRALQGALTGTVSAAMTLVASAAPRARSGYALGLLQMAVWIGASVGPLLGGLVADTWGYRAAFWVTGGLLFVAWFTTWRWVEERFEPPEGEPGKPDSRLWDGFRQVFGSRALLGLFTVRLAVRVGDRLIGPVLPLFIQSLAPPTARVASLTGLIAGVAAGTSAIGAVVLGRASDRLGARPVLLLALGAAVLLFVPHYFAVAPLQLLALQAGVGLVMGGVWASVSASLAVLAPEGRQGAVYGVDASVVSLGNTVGPMLGASVAAGLGLRTPFLLTAGVLALALGLAWRLMPRPPGRAERASD